MKIVPFEPRHIDMIALQPDQQYMRPWLAVKEFSDWLAAQPYSYTGIEGDRVLFCAGVLPMWEGRGEAWALLAGDLRKDFLKVHLAVKRFFAMCKLRRIEANVDPTSDCAKRWIEMLGFKYEGPMPKFWPDGRDASRYAMVR